MKNIPLPERVLIVLGSLVIAAAVTVIVFMRAYLFPAENRRLDAVLHLIIDDESPYFYGGWTRLS